MDDDWSCYRRGLPHWRQSGATYFVTWRLVADGDDLSVAERDVVAGALRQFDGARYRLSAYVVMNDHVHVLVRPNEGTALQDLLRSWKGFSSRRLRIGGRPVPVWQAEYFDRIIRDERELMAVAHYIADNPVRRWQDGGLGYRWVWISPALLGP